MYSKRDVDGRKQLEAQLKSRKSSQRLQLLGTGKAGETVEVPIAALQLLISLLLEMPHGHAQVKVAR